MSAKRPRPAIPVLVHVDNPTEAASVTVDTSTIERKMDTVINNQERIYDKIPTSSGGGGGSGADLTTVNANTTALAEAIGPANATTGDRNLIGHVINLVGSMGDFNSPVSQTGSTVRGFLNNIRNAVGNAENSPTSTETTVRGLLTAIKENTASGTDLTTVNENTTAAATAIGTTASGIGASDLIGLVKNIRAAIGIVGTGLPLSSDSVRSFLYNMREGIGDSANTPSATGTTVRDLLTAIKQNTASGGGGGGGSADLTTVNEKTTALATAIGSADDSSSTVSVIGLLKSITDKY